MARIDFRELTKTFPGGTKAVDALDLEIADGEFMVVVGPSGSGKTTVLRIAAGLEQATTGEVWIGDERRERRPADGPRTSRWCSRATRSTRT